MTLHEEATWYIIHQLFCFFALQHLSIACHNLFGFNAKESDKMRISIETCARHTCKALLFLDILRISSIRELVILQTILNERIEFTGVNL